MGYINHFLQPDTLISDYTNPQTLNFFGYVRNNPVNFNDPTGHCEVADDSSGCGPYGGNGSKGNGKNKDDRHDDDIIKDEVVGFLNGAATVTQDIAMLIDIPFAITEAVFIAGECVMAPPEGCAIGAFMGQEAFNLSGANFIESMLSGASLTLTFFADAMDDGELGEATSTSFSTFVVGGAMFDPIGDLIVDGYASGYNHGSFSGIESLMNGEPFFKNKHDGE